MKGIELARSFYEEFGAAMIAENFPELESKIAIGLVGEGSECFGFDDEISRDHDFEPGFCMFIPDDIDSRTEFKLERAYAKLPKEYMGIERLKIKPVGGSRHGVIRTSDFYRAKTGSADGFKSISEWINIPEFYLAAATNGEVFKDNLGEFTALRNHYLNMPEDVRLKKLAGCLIMMNQSGQYNYLRCIKHGETGAAQLAVHEFSQNAMKAIFLLNRRYMPFYKWSFRAMRELAILPELADSLEFLISSDNEADTVNTKCAVIEDISGLIIEQLKKQDLTDLSCDDLEKYAYSVNDRISDSTLRTAHIMMTV